MSFKYQQYRIASTLNEADACELTRRVLGGQIEFEQIFRDNRHSFCASFHHDDRRLVLKITRGRNTRTWERLLTWFRPSECFRIYTSHLRLEHAGFRVPGPVLAAEKRFLGCVVDGFVIYEFLEGEIAREEHAQAVLDTLLDLHARGFTRNDPKLVNFVVTDAGIGLIDFKLTKPVLFRRLRTRLELAHFLYRHPDVDVRLPSGLGDEPGFKLTQKIYAFKRLLRGKRRYMKARLKRRTRP